MRKVKVHIMTFNDIFKSNFLANVTAVTPLDMALTIVLAFCIGLFIFFIYKKTFAGVMYSSSFGVTLVALTMITSITILAVTSNVVLSLGMVGALSIVRFRTAIKEPLDIAFLFWSIAVGIICGAGLYGIAAVLSITITVLILVLELVPQAKAPQILLISFEDSDETNDGVERILTESKSYYSEKSRTITNGQISLAFEIRTSDGRRLCSSLSGLNGVNSVSLLKHDGEVTY